MPSAEFPSPIADLANAVAQDGAGEDDFLSEAEPAAPWSADLEAVRGEVLDWAAAAVRARFPQAAEWRGAKGLQQIRQDMDLHLRHLLQAPPDRAAAAMASYRQWLLATIWSKRTSAELAVQFQAAGLAEGLARFAPWPVGLRAAEAIAGGLGAPGAVRSQIAEFLKLR